MKFITLLLFLMMQTGISSFAQDTLYIQDFEPVPRSPEWKYTGSPTFASGLSGATDAPPNVPFGTDTSRAWEAANFTAGFALEFNNVPISGTYDSLYVTFRVGAFGLGSATAGMDGPDYLEAEVSLDGGTTYYSRLTINGWSNSFWGYDATGIATDVFTPSNTPVNYAPSNGGYQTAEGYSTVILHLPDTAAQVRIRITLRSSNANERWCVDNLMLIGKNAVSVNEPQSREGIHIYPNPAAEYLLIRLPSPSEKTSVTVHDMTGRQILRNERIMGSRTKISLAGIPDGIYLVNVATEKSSVIKRVIVSR